MKKTLHFALLFIAVCGFWACNGYKSEYEQAMNEKAALQKRINELNEEDKLIRGEYSDAIETLNSIEDTLRTIADREKEIQKLSQSSEFSGNLTQKQAILDKLKALSQANNESKNQAKQLQERIKAYKIENEQMKKMIAQAEQRVLEKERQLEDAKGLITDLQKTLNKLEGQLLEKTGELATTYEELKNERDRLAETNAELQKTLTELQKKSTTVAQQTNAYIACGSKSELRRNKILSATTLKLTKEYQEGVRATGKKVSYDGKDEFSCGDESEPIELVLPEREPSSYEIDGNKLIVKNPEVFWMTDKIVVLVKK